MTPDELKAELRATHTPTPQRLHSALEAHDAIVFGLNRLASLGHSFEIVAKPKAAPVEFPKMFYHETFGEIVVHSEEAAKALSPGWQDKPIGFAEVETETVVSTPAATSSPLPLTVDIAEAMAAGRIVNTQQ